MQRPTGAGIIQIGGMTEQPRGHAAPVHGRQRPYPGNAYANADLDPHSTAVTNKPRPDFMPSSMPMPQSWPGTMHLPMPMSMASLQKPPNKKEKVRRLQQTQEGGKQVKESSNPS